MVTHSLRPRCGHRGSALQITMIILMVMFTLGTALLEVTTGSLLRSRNDMLRAEALDTAEGGVEKAIYYLRNTAPDGTNDGSKCTSTSLAGAMTVPPHPPVAS